MPSGDKETKVVIPNTQIVGEVVGCDSKLNDLSLITTIIKTDGNFIWHDLKGSSDETPE